MAKSLAERAITGDLIGRQCAPQPGKLRAERLALVERLIAREFLALHLQHVRQQRRPPPMPRPFLELQPEPVNLLVEDALRVGVAAQQPAPLLAEEKRRLSIQVDDAARRGAGGEPCEVLRPQHEKAIAALVAQEGRDALVLGLDVAAAVGFGIVP